MDLMKSRFWVELADRAIKSFAQGMLLAFGASQTNDAFEFDWQTALGFGLGMTVISVLTSIASGQIGTPNTPTALPLPAQPGE